MTTPMVSVVGWHNAGKTLFIERLVVELRSRGLRVATIKHSRGEFEMDHPGTDTWRFAQAGSEAVAISGGGRLALLQNRAQDATLDEIVALLPRGLDLILVEGFKRLPLPKIEVTRAGVGEGRIGIGSDLLALVTDDAPVGGCTVHGLPCFRPDDASGVAALLRARGLLR